MHCRLPSAPRNGRPTEQIRGTAEPHSAVTGTGTGTGTKESGTLVACFSDVGPLGLGRLVGNAPYMLHGRTPDPTGTQLTFPPPGTDPGHVPFPPREE